MNSQMESIMLNLDAINKILIKDINKLKFKQIQQNPMT